MMPGGAAVSTLFGVRRSTPCRCEATAAARAASRRAGSKTCWRRRRGSATPTASGGGSSSRDTPSKISPGACFSAFGGHFQCQRKARGAPYPGRCSRAQPTRTGARPSHAWTAYAPPATVERAGAIGGPGVAIGGPGPWSRVERPLATPERPGCDPRTPWSRPPNAVLRPPERRSNDPRTRPCRGRTWRPDPPNQGLRRAFEAAHDPSPEGSRGPLGQPPTPAEPPESFVGALPTGSPRPPGLGGPRRGAVSQRASRSAPVLWPGVRGGRGRPALRSGPARAQQPPRRAVAWLGASSVVRAGILRAGTSPAPRRRRAGVA